MWPGTVVVGHKLGEDLLEVSPREDQQMVNRWRQPLQHPGAEPAPIEGLALVRIEVSIEVGHGNTPGMSG